MDGTNNTYGKVLSILFSAALFFFILTFSIGLPIYARFFYYAQIDGLGLTKDSKYTKEEIIDAYDEVLDYLTLPGKEFSAGKLAYSDEGKAHFEDCKVLFNLNASVLLGSLVAIVIILIIKSRFKTGPLRLGKHSSAFYSALAVIIVPVVLGIAVAVDFEKAFVIFHKIFFPGKDNWLFSVREDEIIKYLPEVFFLRCGILIGVSVLTWCVGIFIFESIQIRKNRHSNVQ